jgi:hypothetical protein
MTDTASLPVQATAGAGRGRDLSYTLLALGGLGTNGHLVDFTKIGMEQFVILVSYAVQR